MTLNVNTNKQIDSTQNKHKHIKLMLATFKHWEHYATPPIIIYFLNYEINKFNLNN